VTPLSLDINITVGGSPCLKPKTSDDTLSCDPPATPNIVDGKGNSVVVVRKYFFNGVISQINLRKRESPNEAKLAWGKIAASVFIEVVYQWL